MHRHGPVIVQFADCVVFPKEIVEIALSHYNEENPLKKLCIFAARRSHRITHAGHST